MKFEDYFTFEQFKNIIEYCDRQDNLPNRSNAWKDYQTMLNENYNPPLIKFLTDLRDTRGLPKIVQMEGHASKFSQVWNNFLDKKIDTDFALLAECFEKVLSKNTYISKEVQADRVLYREKYVAFVNKFTTGNIHYYDMSDDMCQCYECGQKMQLLIKDWKLGVAVYGTNAEGNLDIKVLEKPKSCLSKNMTELTLDFPTGNLLIADWFRIPEFTKAVEYNGSDKYENNRNICYGPGRAAATTYLAESFNFISVSVGNSSPSVFKDGDNLVIGHEDYESEEDQLEQFEDVGSVCTDLWNVTIIDKQDLINIVAKTKGDEANEIVEQYLKDNKRSYTNIQVSPGKYTLKFHGNYFDFNKTMKGREDNVLPNLQKLFMVSKNELTLDNNKKFKM